MPANGTELQYLPSLNVDGLGDIGFFDKFTGGYVTAKPVKHRPGGMGPEVSYLALPIYSDVTISRVYEEDRDNNLIATLHNLVGSTYATVAVQPLDADGNPYLTPRTYRGRIAAVKDGTADSTSENPRMWELDLQVEKVSN